MARKPRLHVPGGLYHMMLRSNGGADQDFARKLDALNNAIMQA